MNISYKKSEWTVLTRSLTTVTECLAVRDRSLYMGEGGGGGGGNKEKYFSW